MLSLPSRVGVAKRSNGKFISCLDEATENEKRCQQILECKRQIEYWKSKLRVLEKEQTSKIKLARLRLDAASTWRSLSSRDRMEKKFILAAMESSEDLPGVLDDFPNSNLPPSIRMDRDILLARVARPDFKGKYDDDRLFVPPKLRGDKQVMLAIIPKHCAVVESMAGSLRDDPEIFEAVLASESKMPAYVLQHFSERIRSDEALMLRLCAHPNGISSMNFLSPDIRNNKAFLLKAIEASREDTGRSRQAADHNGNSNDNTTGVPETHLILRYASQRLQDDAEVVLAAVEQCGLNLKHASYTLRREYTIARAAIEENGTAFRYCLPGDAKDRLLADYDLVIDRILQTEAPNHSTLRLCIDRFPTNQEIIMEVLRHGIEWSLLPEHLRDSKEFAKFAVVRNPQSYSNLPLDFRADFEIASTLVNHCEHDGVDDTILLEAAEHCPQLRSNREAMLAIAKRRGTQVLQQLLPFCPARIRADKELMLEAVRTDPNAYDFCAESLSMDRDILLATVGSCPSYLYLVPASVQLANPEIVVRAIDACHPMDSWSLYEDVCEALWSNRTVAIAWLSRFGEWIAEFPYEFDKDEEICLALVRQNWTEFENCSLALRRNKEFMLRAVAIDARVVEYLEDDENDDDSDSDNDDESLDLDEDDKTVSKVLRYDDDLTLRAFANDKRAILSYSGGSDFEYMVSLTERLRKRIDERRAFEDVFLAAIVNPVRGQSSCCLPLLNQGPHTVQHHSRLIASYLGLPDGEELEMLRRASANLLHWGF